MLCSVCQLTLTGFVKTPHGGVYLQFLGFGVVQFTLTGFVGLYLVGCIFSQGKGFGLVGNPAVWSNGVGIIGRWLSLTTSLFEMFVSDLDQR